MKAKAPVCSEMKLTRAGRKGRVPGPGLPASAPPGWTRARAPLRDLWPRARLGGPRGRARKPRTPLPRAPTRLGARSDPPAAARGPAATPFLFLHRVRAQPGFYTFSGLEKMERGMALLWPVKFASQSPRMKPRWDAAPPAQPCAVPARSAAGVRGRRSEVGLIHLPDLFSGPRWKPLAQPGRAAAPFYFILFFSHSIFCVGFGCAAQRIQDRRLYAVLPLRASRTPPALCAVSTPTLAVFPGLDLACPWLFGAASQSVLPAPLPFFNPHPAAPRPSGSRQLLCI